MTWFDTRQECQLCHRLSHDMYTYNGVFICNHCYEIENLD